MTYLFHYTSYAVFQSILENNTLRLSEHNFLNDNGEINSFFCLIDRVIDQNKGCCCPDENCCDVLFCNAKNSIKKEEAKIAVQLFKHMIMENDVFNYYIFSMSEEKDKNVLWSNFVGNDGLSFSLNSEKINEYVQSMNRSRNKWNLPYYNLHKVNYIDFNNNEKIDGFLSGEVIVKDYYTASDTQLKVHQAKRHKNTNYPFYYKKSTISENSDDAISTLETVINDALYFICTTYKDYPDKTDFINHFKDIHNNNWKNIEVLKMKIYTLLSYLPLIKSEYFQEEKEWRIVVLSDIGKDDNVEINAVNNIFYRFKTIYLSDCVKDNFLLTTGPLLSLKPDSFILIQNKNIHYLAERTFKNLEPNLNIEVHSSLSRLRR